LLTTPELSSMQSVLIGRDRTDTGQTALRWPARPRSHPGLFLRR